MSSKNNFFGSCFCLGNTLKTLGLAFCFAAALPAAHLQADDSPSVALALTFRPVQKDVEYELVDKADYEKCKVKVERDQKSSGWVVYGPEGQVLRRFRDTNADNIVDQWQYYNRGYEVYRDIDSNFNNKVDQSRWMNIAGTRWGIDQNEDGKIDQWKVISAEEVTREAVQAMASGDARRLSLVVINKADIAALGIEPEFANKILANVTNLPAIMKAKLEQSKTVNEKTKWLRFDSSMLMPYSIPADEGKAKQDLFVYENVMAIIETDGKTGFMQMGEVIKLGDTWKLTQIPTPIEGDTLQVSDGGVLMQPKLATNTTAMTTESEVNPETRKLLAELQQLDSNAPTPQSSAEELARYNSKRVDVIRKLLALSKTEQERTQWLRQMIDGLAAAVQTGKYAVGARQLASIETDLKKQRPDSDLIPYTTYRRLLADYSVKLHDSATDSAKSAELQKWWVEQLKSFVTTYPKATDSGDALLQLAIFEEFSGEVEKAKNWYEKLVAHHPATDPGKRAKGALKRLNMIGKPFTMSGNGIDGKPIDTAAYRGKVLLVIFWATWCQPCTEDLPQIKALYEKYRAKGFEIVGVNLDSQKAGIAPYISQHGNSWRHLAEPMGLEGRTAIEFGIISVPTMFLIDQQGKVVSNASSVEDLKEQLPKLLK